MGFESLVNEDQANEEELLWISQNQGCAYVMCRPGWRDRVSADRHAILIRVFPSIRKVIRITVPVELLNHLPNQQNYAYYWELYETSHPELELKSKVDRLKALAAASITETKKAFENTSEMVSHKPVQHSHHQGERAGISRRSSTGG